MKKLNCLLLFIVSLFAVPGRVEAGQVVPMPGLGKPNSITVDKDRLYITDQGSISIYSLKDFKLIKTFGKLGEGPGEFRLSQADKVGLRIALHDDTILVNSTGRISFFTKQGEFKKQVNISEPFQFLKTLGERFVGFTPRVKAGDTLYLTVNLYEPQGLEMGKEIFRMEYYGQMGHIPDCLRFALAMKEETRRGALFQVYKDRLYVEGKDSKIHVFDATGKKLYTIENGYEKIKLPGSFKKEVLAFFEERYPNVIYPIVKQKGGFPEYFPLRYFHVTGDKVYVLTFKSLEGKSEFYILDLQGKLLKKVMVPFADAEFLLTYPYTVGNNKLYQLTENLDSEEWELHINDL